MSEYVALLGSLFVVDLLAAMSPGPNFLVVSQSALSGPRGRAAAAVLGIVSMNLLWCLGVAVGLSSLFAVVPALYVALKVLGGLYLIHLGVRLWRSAGESPEPEAPPSKQSTRSSFGRAFLTAATNPKSVVYFGSVFSVFMHPDAPLWVQAAAVGIVLMNALLWYGSVALLFSSALVQRRYAAIRAPIDRIAGAAIGAFGARLVFVRD
ncbi:MAG: LysE family translocator [Chloroflexota bacterium]|nr:LysE family translocator [Chloroflexota bacterium]